MTTTALPATSTATPRTRGFDATWLIWIGLIAVLVFLVVSPFVHLLVASFRSEKTGAFTFANYAAAYGRERYVQALINSLELGACSASLAGFFAVPLAWAVSRTDMPGRGLVRTLVLATFVTPPYTGAVAWILLAGPNAGWLNKIFVALTGAESGPFNIYSFPGLVMVVALYSYPYIFIFTTAALRPASPFRRTWSRSGSATAPTRRPDGRGPVGCDAGWLVRRDRGRPQARDRPESRAAARRGHAHPRDRDQAGGGGCGSGEVTPLARRR